VLADLVDRFGDDTDPNIARIVAAARELQD
jgi:hypothetical protein